MNHRVHSTRVDEIARRWLLGLLQILLLSTLSASPAWAQRSSLAGRVVNATSAILVRAADV